MNWSIVLIPILVALAILVIAFAILLHKHKKNEESIKNDMHNMSEFYVQAKQIAYLKEQEAQRNLEEAERSQKEAERSQKEAERSQKEAEIVANQYAELKQVTEQEKAEEKEIRHRRYVSKGIKQRVLERDNYTCRICGISKGMFDSIVPGLGDYLLLEVDHIIPVANGGSGDSINNLQTLCWRCNRKKGKNLTNEDVAKRISYSSDGLRAYIESQKEERSSTEELGTGESEHEN